MMALYAGESSVSIIQISCHETDLNDRFWRAPCKGGVSHGCKTRQVKLFQPEAIGAVMEAAKWLKPLV